MMPTFEVVLATFQGVNFVAEQIESILPQLGETGMLLLRDDGSEDGTKKLCQQYAERYPNKIRFIQSQERLGVKKNFSALLERTTAPYVFLADQDDVWTSNKIADSLKEMMALEKHYGKETPLLVHTDLKVVDRNLKVLCDSFWKYTHLTPAKSQCLPKLLVQNVVTGCTSLLNRALINLTLPIPNDCLMHDGWIALTACVFGHISALPEATVLYRQHGQNTLGAEPFFHPARLIRRLESHQDDGRRRKKQAQYFYDRFQSRLSEENRQILLDFLKLDQLSWLQNRRLILKRGFFKNGYLRNLVLFLPSPYP